MKLNLLTNSLPIKTTPGQENLLIIFYQTFKEGKTKQKTQN